MGCPSGGGSHWLEQYQSCPEGRNAAHNHSNCELTGARTSPCAFALSTLASGPATAVFLTFLAVPRRQFLEGDDWPVSEFLSEMVEEVVGLVDF